MCGTIHSTKQKGVRYLNLTEGYILKLGLDKNDEVIGYQFINLGKFMDAIKNGVDPKEAFDKKCAGERVDADLIASIKDRSNDKGSWLWGMLFDNENKKAYFINMWDNSFKSPGKDNDKYISLTETEYRERPTTNTETERENLPF